MVGKTVDVRPTTNELIMFFRDLRATNSNTYPENKFKVYSKTMPYDLNNNIALALKRFSIEYAGMQYPVPDADMSYKDGKNTYIKLWQETMTQNRTAKEDHSEDFETWLRLGPYFFFNCLRPGLDRSTRVTINTQYDTTFPVAINNGTTVTIDNALEKYENFALCIVDVSRQAVKLEMKNGQYERIIIEEQ